MVDVGARVGVLSPLVAMLVRGECDGVNQGRRVHVQSDSLCRGRARAWDRTGVREVPRGSAVPERQGSAVAREGGVEPLRGWRVRLVRAATQCILDVAQCLPDFISHGFRLVLNVIGATS